MPMTDLLAGFPVTVVVPVAWNDMDAFAHVNNTVYLRWFETARIAYFERSGLVTTLPTSGIGPILASLSCRYRRPVVYPDTVEVGIKVTDVGADRFTMVFRIASRTQQAVVAEGDGLIVTYDYGNKRKAPMPDALRDAIVRVEQGQAP